MITKIATGVEGAEDLRILKRICKSDEPIGVEYVLKNVTTANETVQLQNVTVDVYDKFTCRY